MEILIFMAIPIVALIIASVRATKGKRSFLLLTIVAGCYTIFGTIATINAMGKDDDSAYLCFKIVVVTIIEYIAAVIITGRLAKKNSNKNDKQ